MLHKVVWRLPIDAPVS